MNDCKVGQGRTQVLAGLVLFLGLSLFLYRLNLYWRECGDSRSGKADLQPVDGEQFISSDPVPFSATDISESLLFVGDAGAMRPSAEELLRQQASVLADRLTIIFLGDNVYFHGLPPAQDADYPRATNELNRQIQAARVAGARVVFVPGNHDWDDSGPDGWNAIRRQQSFVEGALGSRSFLPGNACPGPESTRVSEHFRLVALDSEWQLRSLEKPIDAQSGCPTYGSEQIKQALANLVADTPPGVWNVVVQHHPLKSYGIIRKADYPQSMISEPYRRMRKDILDTLDPYRGRILCVAGHDHNLQVIRGERGCRYFFISGSMSFPKRIESFDSNLHYGSHEVGMQRLDRMYDGRLRITVWGPGPGPGRALYSEWLDVQ